MTSTTNDIYEILVKKSKITDNYATLTHIQVNELMIPCNDFEYFYNDSLFYLHLYNTLYLEILNRDQQDNFNIETFKSRIANLSLSFTNSACLVSDTKMGDLTNAFTFDTACFRSNGRTYNSKYITHNTLNRYLEYIVDVTRGAGDRTGTGGKIKITLNVATGAVNANINSAGTGYTTVPTVVSPIPGYTFTLAIDSGAINTVTKTAKTGQSGVITNYLFPQINNIYITGIADLDTSFINGVTAQSGVYTFSTAQNNTLNTGLTTKYDNYNNADKYNNNDNARKQKFRRVIYDILNTPAENFISYLFYNRVYYNVIVCNCSIQNIIRDKYLNKNTINMNDTSGFNANADLSGIKTNIENMKTNLDNLKTSIDYITSDFIKDKSKYSDKIILLNETKREYYKVETNLNRVIKDYNSYLENYQRIKIYASAVIVFLILLIIGAILITVLPFFNYNSKNTYYIVILIILIVLLGIYYANFRHVGLYETFRNCDTAINTYNPLHPDTLTRNNHKTNNYNFFNNIIDYLNTYNNSYSELNDELSASVYIGNNKTYTADANDYLYKLYIDKKRKTELNRLKKVSLTNHIEAMKKQIVNLFNIILVIGFLAIVLLISMIVYTSAPFYLNYVIAFAVIAIIIIVIFYIFASRQPTRMKVSKNYWANKNPTDETINNL